MSNIPSLPQVFNACLSFHGFWGLLKKCDLKFRQVFSHCKILLTKVINKIVTKVNEITVSWKSCAYINGYEVYCYSSDFVLFIHIRNFVLNYFKKKRYFPIHLSSKTLSSCVFFPKPIFSKGFADCHQICYVTASENILGLLICNKWVHQIYGGD